MKKLIVTFNEKSSNDFGTNLDMSDASARNNVANLLKQVAARIETGDVTGKYQNVLDSSGSIVGNYIVKEFN